MIKVIMIGACGKMGQSIIKNIYEQSDMMLTGAIEVPNHSLIGKNISLNEKEVILKDNLTEVISEADIIVDFTNSKSTCLNLEIIAKNKKPVIIGTTGFKEEELKFIQKIAQNIPIILSANMSIGVNLLFKIVKDITSVLKEGYDIEIIEAHHRFKKDAPSGTAKKIAEIINSVQNLKEVYGRCGLIGERKKEELGINVIRAGDIVGEHTVIFGGIGERLEITHKAHNRDTFAKGVITAIRFLNKIKDPGLYDMQDVLNLK